ncbi:hypothetical protein V8C86DRAFT_3034694, partial [Haematococcus lacustris]
MAAGHGGAERKAGEEAVKSCESKLVQELRTLMEPQGAGVGGGPGVLDYVGRHIADSPRLLPELSRLLQMDDSALARAIVPHVIGWLCLHRKADALATLAELLGTTSQALFANYADHAIAYAFWVGNQRIGDFVEFVDALMAPQDDDFISVTKVTAKDVAQQVIWQAGLPLHWDGTYDPPSDIVACSHDYLDELAKIMGLTGPTRAAELLSGHPVANLLKDFGDSFKGGPPQHSGPGAPSPATSHPHPCPPHPAAAGGSGGGEGWGRGRGVGAERRSSLLHDSIEAKQLHSLRALCCCVLLLGRFLSDWVSHIMAVLTAALRDVRSPVVKLQALTAWRVFVGALAEAAPTLMGRIVVQVAVVLLPALEEGGAGQGLAVAILEDLVLTHRSHTAAALARMPPLPSLPGLERLHGVLGREQGSGQQGKHLKLLISALEHESLAVRHSGLGELRGFLTKQRKWVGNLLSAALGMDTAAWNGPGAEGGVAGASRGPGSGASRVRPDAAELLGSLMASLLRCCENAMRTHLGMSLRDRCGECLGALGAIEPARLTVTLQPPLPLVDGGIDGQGVARMAVTRHLVRILTTTSDLGTLEFVSYAIQARDRAILQHYSQFPTSGSRPPKSASRPSLSEATGLGDASGVRGLYSHLPQETRAIVRPFLYSKYIVQDNTASNAAASATAAAAASASAGTESVMGVAALVREDSDASAQIADDAAAPRGPGIAGRANSSVGSALTSGKGRSDAGTGALQQMSSAGSGLTAGLGPAGTGPVLFGSRQFSCRRWLELWLRGMIKASTGPCQPAFNALATCLKFDLPLMLYALPQVVFNVVVLGSPAAVASIRAEIAALLSAASQSVGGGAAAGGGRGGAGQGGPMDPGGGAPGASTGSSRVPRQPPHGQHS